MTTSEQIHELATALSKAQGEMAAAAKDGSNPHFRSKFATLASVWEAARVPLTKHGLAVVQGTSTDGPRVTVTSRLLHGSGQWIQEELTLTAQQDTPQGVGSAISYGRRYGLSALVGITADDDDGEAAEGRSNGKTQRPIPAPHIPSGYSDWLTGFTTAAESGLDSMRAFWRESPPTMRDFLMQTAPQTVDRLKERATFVDTTKTPVSPELAHEEAVAKMRPKASRA